MKSDQGSILIALKLKTSKDKKKRRKLVWKINIEGIQRFQKLTNSDQNRVGQKCLGKYKNVWENKITDISLTCSNTLKNYYSSVSQKFGLQAHQHTSGTNKVYKNYN